MLFGKISLPYNLSLSLVIELQLVAKTKKNQLGLVDAKTIK